MPSLLPARAARTWRLLFAGVACGALLSSATAQQAITGHGESKPILPHLVGYNNQMANAFYPWGGAFANPNNNQLLRRQALVAARPGTLRYPGGSVSSYWDFFAGRLFNAAAAIDPDDTTEPFDFTQRQYTLNWVANTTGQPNTVHDFMGAYDALAASPEGPMQVIFVLNLVTPGVDYYRAAGLPELPALNDRPARPARPGPLLLDQTPGSDDWWAMMDARYLRAIAMLDEARWRGIPIRYVELGNEYFFGANIADPVNGATVEPYSAGATNDASMWGAFPERDTAWDDDDLPDRGRAYAVAANDWAKLLLARYPGVRLCAIGSDANGNTPTRRNSWNTDVLANVDKTLIPAVGYHIYGKVPNTFTSEAGLGSAFATFRNNWAFDKQRSVMPADREVWITEWNNNQSVGTWGHGLASTFQLLHWLEEETRFGLSSFHQFGQGILGGSIPAPNGAITATGRAFSLLSLAMKGHTLAWKVNVADVPNLSGQTDLPALHVWAFGELLNRQGRYLAINYSANTFTLDAAQFTPTGNVHQASRALVPGNTDPGEAVSAASDYIVLPPFSITVFNGRVPFEGDVTAPTVAVQPGTNPAGKRAPNAAAGFVLLTATDDHDPAPEIYVRDSATDFLAGPYASGTTVKITRDPNATPTTTSMPGAVVTEIVVRGTAEVFAVDESGNSSDPAPLP